MRSGRVHPQSRLIQIYMFYNCKLGLHFWCRSMTRHSLFGLWLTHIRKISCWFGYFGNNSVEILLGRNGQMKKWFFQRIVQCLIYIPLWVGRLTHGSISMLIWLFSTFVRNQSKAKRSEANISSLTSLTQNLNYKWNFENVPSHPKYECVGKMASDTEIGSAEFLEF